MDKVKKIVILPVFLLFLEWFLQTNYASVYLFQNLQLDFGKVMPRILLSFLAVLLFVCGIAVLFVWVFDNTSPKTLLNQSTAKLVGLAFAINYLIILFVEPMLYSLISHLYRPDVTPWLYILSDALVSTFQSFFVISIILWSILKPLRGRFTFHTKAFIVAGLLCLIINVLYIYMSYQITSAILSTFQTEKADNSVIGFLSTLAESDKYSDLLKVASAIIHTIQDVIILLFINFCINHKEKVEIQNV